MPCCFSRLVLVAFIACAEGSLTTSHCFTCENQRGFLALGLEPPQDRSWLMLVSSLTIDGSESESARLIIPRGTVESKPPSVVGVDGDIGVEAGLHEFSRAVVSV